MAVVIPVIPNKKVLLLPNSTFYCREEQIVHLGRKSNPIHDQVILKTKACNET